MLPGDSILSRASLDRLHDMRNPGEPSHMRYMGGWGVVDDGSSVSMLSDGQVLGFNTALLLVPADTIGVVCLVNRTGSDALQAAIEIIDAIKPGYAAAFGRFVERMGSIESARGENAIGELAGRWRGTVWNGRSSLPATMTVGADGGAIWRVAKIGEGTIEGAFFADRPDKVVSGITFRAPGLTGRVAGLDLIHRRRLARASLAIELHLEDDVLIGAVTNAVEDDSVPMLVRLERKPYGAGRASRTPIRG